MALDQALGKIDLPVLTRTEPTRTAWHEWTATSDTPLPRVLEAPEPAEPQGMYGQGIEPQMVRMLPTIPMERKAELLAPAGGPEAGYAALHFGADAIYLGLKKFSARAEAENFSLAEVEEITAYAHSLQPRRRVFVTINTVLRQDELAELIADVEHLAGIGVDAIILQDLGVYWLLRQHFPTLELHASTQLAVHNGAGVQALRQLGFSRVVLARELTFEEVRDITHESGLETEVFIHGALCYSYSGLCLFSAQTLGRSGNRGKCSYSCRDSFQVEGAPLTLRDGTEVKRDPHEGFPFSMKDLALPDYMPALQEAGVSCFKIEGRKKSPLYVATTTDYYRSLLDGRMPEENRPEREAELQTVFSRPWTQLFLHSHRDKEVADRDTVGHRGTQIGRVEKILGESTREPRLQFRTKRRLERHDGLQIDLPVLGKPFGFAVEQLWVVDARRNKKSAVYAAPAGALVEVSLPREHPALPSGAPVYCSSSQEVKQKYRSTRPKPGQFRNRLPLQIDVRITPDELRIQATAKPLVGDSLQSVHRLAGPFAAAQQPLAMAQALQSTFEKLGNTGLFLESSTIHNDASLFVPISRLNDIRREMTAALEATLAKQQRERIAELWKKLLPAENAKASSPGRQALQWTLKVDRIEYLDDLKDEDLAEVEEIIVDIARDHPTVLAERLTHWSRRLGPERIRLALPPITRAWEEKGLRQKLGHLLPAWKSWEVGNVSGWTYLGLNPGSRETAGLDIACDWSLYVVNRLAALQVMAMGATRFALSPEDGFANVKSLLAEFADQAVVIVHQDTPLFLAESCAYANLIGGCPGKANCSFESMEMVSRAGEKVTALDYHCRTIVLNHGPFSLTPRLKELQTAGARRLRADFVYRRYEPAEVHRVWQLIRAGKPVPGGHAANFDRGLL